MKTNKTIFILVLLILINIFTINSVNIANATTINGQSITIIKKIDLTRGDVFNFFAEYYNEVPESYKYIKLNYLGIQKDTPLEKSLKKLIYLDLIKNPRIKLNQNEKISAWAFYRLSEKILKIKIIDKETKKELLNRNANTYDLLTVKNFIGNTNINIDLTTTNQKIREKQEIFNNIYKTLLNKYYDKENLDKLKLLNSAIEGLVKGTGDKHTVYFPPVKNQTFHDALAGEYEGIGSYVDMEKPGILKITSPIPGSPSEKAGLKGGDIVLKVDGKEITKENSLLEVISWIKGPAGTDVILTIDRNGVIKDYTVTRDKIIITDIDSKKINSDTYYIKIKSFGEHVASEFKKALEPLEKRNSFKKVIIDLRNDGGGYLDQVTEILSYFIPKGEKTAVVKYHDKNYTKNYISKGYDNVDFSKYKIVILQNSGTASASEILIGTLKDYYENIVIIGEQSYGKGSVQTMQNYSDGSSLKYTIAKWFTGGSETGIDGVGITPTIKLDFDFESYKKYKKDNQLEKAKSIR
ncbi:S41 family peptidase [Candidatus Gracilibacteria bacterium]|nr:S41 family peptidase [Candidatus Gracilibacteria bacterium]